MVDTIPVVVNWDGGKKAYEVRNPDTGEIMFLASGFTLSKPTFLFERAGMDTPDSLHAAVAGNFVLNSGTFTLPEGAWDIIAYRPNDAGFGGFRFIDVDSRRNWSNSLPVDIWNKGGEAYEYVVCTPSGMFGVWRAVLVEPQRVPYEVTSTLGETHNLDYVGRLLAQGRVPHVETRD